MKRALPFLLVPLAVWAAVEAAAFCGYWVVSGQVFRPGAASEERARIAAGGKAQADAQADGTAQVLLRLKDQVIHPYVGYVYDPAKNDEEVFAYLGERYVDATGFIGEVLVEEHPDRVVIGITGGSVAMFFTIQGTEALTRVLQRDPRLADKEIVYVTLALAGYKAPQQLFALNYLLVQGGHLDWLVNLDGFNEIALPVIENEPKNVASIFPRSWYWRVENLEDIDQRRWIGQVAYLEGRRGELAVGLQGSALSWSPLRNLVWRLRDAECVRGIAEAQDRLLDYDPGVGRFVAQGPYQEAGSEEELYDRLAEIWYENSLQMHRLCEGNGIRYVHFLQPNQYVPDSKPMGREELRVAVAKDSRFREPVERGYPRLRARGAELSDAGVRFFDLTAAFQDQEAVLYGDNCCHLNDLGNEVLAGILAGHLLEP